MVLKIGSWNIRALSTSDKQKVVRNFISEEKLSKCAVLETHLKIKNQQRVGDGIFGQ